MPPWMLNTSEYLATPKGQYNRYHWRQIHGRSYYSFPWEPPGRRTRVREKASYQKEVLEQLKRYRRQAYRSKIAAEIWLNPTRRNAPLIHSAMKALLDIFETPLPESGIKRKGLFYQNDNQISYLSVRYHPESNQRGIQAIFAPFRHFLEDLQLANDIETGHYDQFSNQYRSKTEMERYYDSSQYPDFSDEIEKLQSLPSQKEHIIKYFGQKAGQKVYEAMHLSNKIAAQEALLRMPKFSIHEIYTLFNASGVFKDRSHTSRLSQTVTGSFIKSPIRLTLPSLPTENHQGNDYKNQLRERMVEFRNHYHILTPLYIPVIIEVIYKPPITSFDFYKDLDNIIGEYILPSFHDVFKPPLRHSYVLLSEESQEGHPSGDVRIRRPKSVPYCVAGYEIFEIPRHGHDRSDGFLLLGITSASFAGTSFWRTMEHLIEKWGKYVLDW